MSSENNEKNRPPVDAEEQKQVARAILTWLNTCSSKPCKIKFEYLPKDDIGIALATAQVPYIIQSYVDGSYEAQYQFSLIYRCQPMNDDERLGAVETLNEIGEWAESGATLPQLDEGKTVTGIKITTSTSIFARYDDGSEDYQIQMTLEYEVEKE